MDTNLVEEAGKECLQDQGDYFERKGSVNRHFLDERYQLDGKVGDTKENGKDLNDGCFDDDVHEDCIPR